MSCVFGPVPSRRLGRSLGVDLVPFKTCTYDCIYCQLGRTTCRTAERREWVRWETVLEQVKRKLHHRPDYITFSGSGEPMLYARIGELIGRIRSIAHIPVAVLTNGSLLWQEDVREELYPADLVIPSLDAGHESIFRYINRPHESISFGKLMEGLIAFREEFTGQYWLEVFLVAGYTSVTVEAERIAECVRQIRPHRVQLNTVTRPPAEPFAEAVPPERLARLATLFEPQAELIAEYAHPAPEPADTSTALDILEMLRRRPCTDRDLVAALGLHINEVIKHLDELRRRGLIEQVVSHQGAYHQVIRGAEATEEQIT